MGRRKKTVLEPPVNVAFSIDYRGVNDDVLTFVFYCYSVVPITKTFNTLSAGGILMSSYDIQKEHGYYYRNGKSYWRWAVTPKEYNQEMLSLDELINTIQASISKQNCNVTYYPNYHKFINI